MTKHTRFFKTLFPLLLVSVIAHSQQTGYPFQQLPLQQVKIEDAFWLPRLKTHYTSTIPAAIVQVRDSTSRISNFEVAAGEKKGKFNGLVWDDSDVYKVMEGIAYSLINHPDTALENMMDGWIDIMAKAQEPDGYLVTFYILSTADDGTGEKLGRWSDIGRHEMYCGGHMIEAAIAYYHATGKRKFLDVASKFADHWMTVFGPSKKHWVPGHQESELALVKLYQVTKEKKYLDFAYWLLEERGHGYEFGPMWESNPRANVDILSDVPVKDITEAKGHAVRAMYMYSGMADVLAYTGDTTYKHALNTLWDDVVDRKMYVTGGVGSMHDGEAFGAPFFLPNKSAYCETCASVGMIFWNSRMNLLSGDAKYVDVLERSLYNAVLAGQSLSGDKFFYTNPLESEGKNHRGGQYGIACCPTNMARLIPQVGEYIYMKGANEIFVNLYVGSEATTSLGDVPVTIKQQTEYPWNGKIQLTVTPDSDVAGKINLRIPDWCTSYTVKLNGKKMHKQSPEKGYLAINRSWQKGDQVEINFDMPVEIIAADARVADNRGKRAIRKGPIVYCMEQVDNPGIDFNSFSINKKTTFKVVDGKDVLSGLKKLVAQTGKNTATFIPYYAWENRQSGNMMVWVNYTE